LKPVGGHAHPDGSRDRGNPEEYRQAAADRRSREQTLHERFGLPCPLQNSNCNESFAEIFDAVPSQYDRKEILNR
jgi:hypothetical protein